MASLKKLSLGHNRIKVSCSNMLLGLFVVTPALYDTKLLAICVSARINALQYTLVKHSFATSLLQVSLLGTCFGYKHLSSGAQTWEPSSRCEPVIFYFVQLVAPRMQLRESWGCSGDSYKNDGGIYFTGSVVIFLFFPDSEKSVLLRPARHSFGSQQYRHSDGGQQLEEVQKTTKPQSGRKHNALQRQGAYEILLKQVPCALVVRVHNDVKQSSFCSFKVFSFSGMRCATPRLKCQVCPSSTRDVWRQVQGKIVKEQSDGTAKLAVIKKKKKA
eukprot:284814549_4